MCCLFGLEVREHGSGVRNLKGIGSGILGDTTSLNKELFNLHVVNEGRVTPRALTETTLCLPQAGHSHATGKEAGTIGKQLHLHESQ